MGHVTNKLLKLTRTLTLTLKAWGDVLLLKHGKSRPGPGSPADLTDIKAKHLGCSTMTLNLTIALAVTLTLNPKANYLGYSTTAYYHHNECDGGNMRGCET